MINFLFLLHCLLWDDYHAHYHDYLTGVVAEFLSIPRQHVIEFKNNANRSFQRLYSIHGSVAVPRSGRNKERTGVLYPFKGIVQRDLTGVETRLKRSALMNYSVAKCAF